MVASLIRRDTGFYTGLFVLWVLAVLLMHGDHYYFGRPMPSVDLAREGGALVRQRKTIDASIEELKKELEEVADAKERMHIEHNIGIAYYDVYKGTRGRDHLDSARQYMAHSIAGEPNVARFYYNFGRIFTEQGDHGTAKVHYEKALECDPTHVLALHNLGLLTYFELRRLDKAQIYLERALNINPRLPICNYVLGEIALDKKEYKKALYRLNQEVRNISKLGSGQNLPTGRANINFALAMTHLQLAGMYSTQFVDRKKAQAHFHAYLQLEKDPKRRAQSMKKMKKYWVMKE